MISDNMAWLGGYLEGEGCFGKSKTGQYKVAAGSTDYDVLDRVKLIVGGKIYPIKPHSSYPDYYKPGFLWSIQNRESATGIMVAVSPFLGQRRRERIAGFGIKLLAPVDWEIASQESWYISWLAGILEAEGCFSIANVRSNHPGIMVRMRCTDEDSTRRCLASGVGQVTGPYTKATYKPLWDWHVNRQSDIVNLLNRLNGHMGFRRQAKINELLTKFSEYHIANPRSRAALASAMVTATRR